VTGNLFFQVMPRLKRTVTKCNEARDANLARKKRHTGITPTRQITQRLASKRADTKILLEAIRTKAAREKFADFENCEEEEEEADDRYIDKAAVNTLERYFKKVSLYSVLTTFC